MKLPIALAWSAVVHVGLLACCPLGGPFLYPGFPRSAELVYVDLEAPAPPQSPKLVSKPAIAPIETVASRPMQTPFSTPALSSLTPRTSASAPRPVAPRPAVWVAPPKVQATRARKDLSEVGFALLEHKEQVREFLRRRLKSPTLWAQGTVRLRLMLGPAGALQEVVVLEASSPQLAQAALADVRSAVPFPPFPKGLRRPHARYDFLVRYEPND